MQKLFFKTIPPPCEWTANINFWWNIESCQREYRHVVFATRPDHRDQGNSQLYIWKEHTIRLSICFGKIFFNTAKICSLKISNAFIVSLKEFHFSSNDFFGKGIWNSEFLWLNMLWAHGSTISISTHIKEADIGNQQWIVYKVGLLGEGSARPASFQTKTNKKLRLWK